MALFGLCGKKSEEGQLKKLALKAGNKRAQAVDRWEALRLLSDMKSQEAVEALLPRFTFYVDPSITDQEEKDLAFEGILKAGDAAIEPVSAFLRKADSISWPLKMLDRLASPEGVVGKLLDLLGGMGVDYERDPEKKVQTLATLEERKDERIVEAVARFLEDANETVRFNAVGAILAQVEAENAKAAMADCLCAEESVRIRNRILDGFISNEWKFEARLEDVKKSVPSGYKVDKAGRPHRS